MYKILFYLLVWVDSVDTLEDSGFSFSHFLNPFSKLFCFAFCSILDFLCTVLFINLICRLLVICSGLVKPIADDWINIYFSISVT